MKDKPNLLRQKTTFFRVFVLMTVCVSLVVNVLPQTVRASLFEVEGSWPEVEEYTSYSDDTDSNSGSSGSGKGSSSRKKTELNVEELIEICKKYSDRGTTTGVRNQIEWMKQLYAGAVQGFCSQLGLGDALLISVLNHSNILTTLMTSSYSIGDINRELARQIVEGAEGYADVNTIAEATGLTDQDVYDILERIAAGSVTEKTIATGKNSSSNTNRGAYLINQAQKQEKVYNYLIEEVERMSGDSDSLNTLYEDLGAGYVNNLLSGYELDDYRVMLYKKYLAKTLDNTLDSENPYSISTLLDITEADAYKVSQKTRSALSELLQHETGTYEKSLSEELQKFLEKHLKNGVLSESEAREFLILSGQYEKGEYGIGEAAKQLVKGYKHLQSLKTVLDSTGDVLSAVEKAKKGVEFIEYWVTNYAEQEVLMDYLIENLSDSGSDMELLVAAKELQEEYESKLSGTFDRVYSELIKKGIGSVKSSFPPLKITEACLSLAGIISGADDQVKALETGLAMQGICKQALDDFENAVITVNQGDTSEEAVSRVMTTFEVARQSLVSYYEAMIQLSETEEEKNIFAAELKKLKNAQFGNVAISSPFSGGGVADGR